MGTHPIFESDFDCLTECFRDFSLQNWRRPVIQIRQGHIFTLDTVKFWRHCSIYAGTVFCLLAFENAERRLKPYEERPAWEAKPWLQSGRNTKFPFDSAHPTRNMFYNPAVNANPHTGYEDGDNERRLFAAPSGFIHDPKKKAIPEADSLEANIFNAEWRAA